MYVIVRVIARHGAVGGSICWITPPRTKESRSNNLSVNIADFTSSTFLPTLPSSTPMKESALWPNGILPTAAPRMCGGTDGRTSSVPSKKFVAVPRNYAAESPSSSCLFYCAKLLHTIDVEFNSYLFETSDANGYNSIPGRSGVNCSTQLSRHCIWLPTASHL